jgi:hypothetical protein
MMPGRSRQGGGLGPSQPSLDTAKWIASIAGVSVNLLCDFREMVLDPRTDFADDGGTPALRAGHAPQTHHRNDRDRLRSRRELRMPAGAVARSADLGRIVKRRHQEIPVLA